MQAVIACFSVVIAVDPVVLPPRSVEGVVLGTLTMYISVSLLQDPVKRGVPSIATVGLAGLKTVASFPRNKTPSLLSQILFTESNGIEISLNRCASLADRGNSGIFKTSFPTELMISSLAACARMPCPGRSD